MIVPSPKDIEPFASFGTSEFERWLKVGLEGYLLEDKNIWSFEHIPVFIGHEDHVVLDLRNIYNAFDGQGRALFRQAVANIIANLEATPRNFIVFEHLLLLASVLPAPEILRALPGRIGNGFFGLAASHERKTLFDVAFLTVAELSAPTSDALRCARSLITSRYYENVYAGLGLTTLCRIYPEGFPGHMALMRASINNMFHALEVGEEVKTGLALQILNAVGLDVIAENLHNMILIHPPIEQVASDTWFVDALFNPEQPLLSILHEGDKILLCRPEKPEVRIEVPSPHLIKVHNVAEEQPSFPIGALIHDQLSLVNEVYYGFFQVFGKVAGLSREDSFT
jgi:hypothetical protein